MSPDVFTIELGGGEEVFRGMIAQNGLNDFDCKRLFLSNAPTLAVWLRGSSFDVLGLTRNEITFQARVKNLCHDVLARVVRKSAVSATSALHASRQRRQNEPRGIAEASIFDAHHPAKHSALKLEATKVSAPFKPQVFKPAVRVAHPYSRIESRKTRGRPTCPERFVAISLPWPGWRTTRASGLARWNKREADG